MASETQEVTDKELAELLAAREKEDVENAEAEAEALSSGPCPICDGVLMTRAAPGLVVPFIRRSALRCGKCRLTTPHVPTRMGWILAIVLAVCLAGGGMSSIFRAQRLSDPSTQKMVFMMGALLFGGGLFLGYGVNGAGNTKLVVQKIVRRRRQWNAQGGKPAAKPDSEDAGWFQENLEAVVVAIILALIIRHFAMEAFVIPTGSMAPTLLGDHFRLNCSNCDYAVDLGKKGEGRVGSLRETLNCPLCTAQTKFELRDGDVVGGHKILVNKFLYKIRPPERYEVIVFKFPRDPWRNYIKRLVGLPGETLRVRNGDLYADGKLARKPDKVQDAIWIPVHDAGYARKKGPPRWIPLGEAADEPTSVWTFDRDGADVLCKPAEVPGAPLTWLDYTREITDTYGYNNDRPSSGRLESNSVADLRVRARVTPAAGSVIRLTIVESNKNNRDQTLDRIVSARFACGPGEQVFGIEADGKLEKSVVGSLEAGVPVEIALCYADDRARLQVGGETVLEWVDPFAPTRTESADVRIGAEGAEVRFERLRIDRDIYYSSSVGAEFNLAVKPIKVPDDGYFAMGDNSPNSLDGRSWGFLRKGHMIGRAFMVFWPVVPFEIQFIR